MSSSANSLSLSEELEAKRGWYAQYLQTNFSAAEQKGTAEYFNDLTNASKNAKKVGDKAPSFELNDYVSGNRVALSSVVSKGPLVLFFYRGAWCPFCNLQVKHYQRSLPAFQAALKDQTRQVQVAGITLQAKEHVEKMKNNAGVTFPLLTDIGGAVTSEYGLLYRVPAESEKVWKEKFGLDLVSVQENPKVGTDAVKKAATLNSKAVAVHDGVELVLPASGVYIIDSKGVIRYANVQTDYRYRADPSEIIEALKAL